MSLDVMRFLVEDFLHKYEELQKSRFDSSLGKIFEDYKTLLDGADITCLHDETSKDYLYILNCAVDDCLVESTESLKSMAKRSFRRCKEGKSVATRDALRDNLIKLESSISCQRGSSVSAPHKPASIPLLNFVVHGFEDQFVKIVEKISSSSEAKMRGVGIVGIGGSGKTTLASMVFNSREVREKYQIMIWASLTNTLNKKESTRGSVFGEILSGVQNYESLKRMLQKVKSYQGGCKMNDNVLDEYIDHFKDVLKRNSGKYLIVLDDVWETDYWFAEKEAAVAGDVKAILSSEWIENTNGTVVVTSRLEEMAENVVGKGNLYMISPVSKEACFDIFLDRANKDNKYFSREDERLKMLKKDIEGRCFGLPLAACTVADIMVAKEEEKTKRIEALKAELERVYGGMGGLADSSKPDEEEGKGKTSASKSEGEAGASKPAEAVSESEAGTESGKAEAEVTEAEVDQK